MSAGSERAAADDAAAGAPVAARSLTAAELFAEGAFRPASVQRDFQWDEETTRRLVIDIAAAAAAAVAPRPEPAAAAVEAPEAEDAPGLPAELAEDAPGEAPSPLASAFLGAIILSEPTPGRFEIYDGLQRLTVLTVLACVLRDRLAALAYGDAAAPAAAAGREAVDNDAEAEAEADAPAETEEGAAGGAAAGAALAALGATADRLAAAVAGPEGGVRLRHAGDDPALWRLAQKPGAALLRRRSRSAPEGAAARRIFDAQRVALEETSGAAPEALAALGRFLLDHTRLAVIRIADPRLARRAFVAANLYGAPLERSAVFKGELAELGRNAAEIRLIERAWKTTADLVGAADLDAFLLDVDQLTRRAGATPDLGDLRAHLAGRAAAGRLGDWLRLLARYAEAWRALKRHLAEPRGAMGTDVWRLGLFAWREWRPLALHYLERDAASPGARRWRARFEDLHRRCMAVTLYRFSAEARARMFLDALRLEMRAEPVRAFTLEGGRRRPLDFSIKVRRFILDGLRNPIEDVQVRRSVLIWRESELWVDRPAPPGYLRAATVEHVLPTKPALSARWAQDFPDAARRHALCHALGNMCLLDREVNAELSNRDYGEKLARLTAAGQHERYRLTADLPSRPEWTEEVVAARTARMAEEIWAALGLPHPDADAPAAPAEAAAGGPG